MRIMTVTEFCDWTDQNKPECFLFSTENNRHFKPYGVQIRERFSSLTRSASSDRLCFRNQSGTLCLEHVKEVRMYDDRDSIGIVFDVVCDMGRVPCVWRMIAD